MVRIQMAVVTISQVKNCFPKFLPIPPLLGSVLRQHETSEYSRVSPSPARVEAEKGPCLSEQVMPTHPPKSVLEVGQRGALGTSGLCV